MEITTDTLTSTQIILFQKNYNPGKDTLVDPNKDIAKLPFPSDDVSNNFETVCFGKQCFRVYSRCSTNAKVVQPV
jgi:hypothetical protein